MAKRAIRILPLVILIFAGAVVLGCSRRVTYYALQSLLLWAKRLVPVLLPYIILSKLWIRYGIIDACRQFLSGLSLNDRTCYILPVFCAGLLCGYPVGAVFVKHYYMRGVLNRNTARALLPLCSFVSPVFLTGYVFPLLELRPAERVLMLLALYLAPVILFFFYCLKRDVYVKHVSSAITTGNPAQQSLQEIPESALEIILMIGVYLMIFTIILGLIKDAASGQIPILFLCANLEVTAGVELLHTLPFPRKICRLLSAVFVLSFGGLCCLAQVASLMADTDLDMKYYFSMKVKQAGLSAALLTCLYVCLFILHSYGNP